MRKAFISRKTKETAIEVRVDLDGTGGAKIATGIGFFDHMLEQVARHSLIDIEIAAKGDLHIDPHHTVEDTGIALGQALRQALGDGRGISRFADVHMPMDETLTRVAIDLSGRPFLVFRTKFTRAKIGDFDTELVREFFQALATHMRGESARRDPIWRKQPSYRRVGVQRSCPGAARRDCDRCAAERRNPFDQRVAGWLTERDMPVYTVHLPTRDRRATLGVADEFRPATDAALVGTEFVPERFSRAAFFLGPILARLAQTLARTSPVAGRVLIAGDPGPFSERAQAS